MDVNDFTQHNIPSVPGNGRPLTPVSLPADDAEPLSYPTTPSSSFQNGLNRPSIQPLRAGSEMSAPASDDLEVRIGTAACQRPYCSHLKVFGGRFLTGDLWLHLET